MKNKIIVVGSMNYDIVTKLPRLPERGETMPAESVSFAAGGKGANQAVQAAKLGVPTYLVGAVGSDLYGDFLWKTAEDYGLDMRYVSRAEAQTGMGIVDALSDGSVYARIIRGANFALTKADIDRAAAGFEEAGILILQMEIPEEINCYAIDKAKACGCKILMNAAPAEKFPLSYFQKCDTVVVNEVEAAYYLGYEISSRELAEQGAKELSERYGCEIVITLGSLGSVCYSGGMSSFFSSKKVKAVETTGAGDSFIGGIAYALLQGKTLPEACVFATSCSAVTVCRIGAQASMPTLAELSAAGGF